MIFTVYSSFRNIEDYENGIPIQCFPERHSMHDVALTFKSNEITLMANQSGIYISKKTRKNIFKKLFKKNKV